MPSRFALIILLVALLWGGAAAPGHAGGSGILVVVGGSIPPFEEAIKGFEQATTALESSAGVKSILPPQLPRLTLAPGDDLARLQERIRERQPSLVLAVGQKALDGLAGLERIPIVYLMVASPEAMQERQENLTGVRLALTPARQLAALLAQLPAIRTVGVIHDPRHTGTMVQEGGRFLAGQERQLVASEASEPQQIAGLLQGMRGKIDALWMVPDRTVITSATLETMALFSMQTHIPIITFSEKYLQSGALLAITADPLAMGKQAALLANRIVLGTPVQKVGFEMPNFAKITSNAHVAEHLGPASGGHGPQGQEAKP